MDSLEYTNILQNEDHHFYYRSVHDLILRMIDKYCMRKEKEVGLSILDAGCGTGALAEKMSAYGDVKAIDMSEDALSICRQRGVPALMADIQSIPFSDNTFDIVTSVDVIYHRNVADDVKALSEIQRVLKPKGVLIMRVPARKELFSSHDIVVWSARRYRRRELKEKILQANLSIRRLSYCHFPLYLPALAKTQIEKVRGENQQDHSAVANIKMPINSVLEAVLKFETTLLTFGLSFPVGLGLFAVAEKS